MNEIIMNEIIMNEANYLIFRCSSSRRKPGVNILKVPREDDEWNSTWRKV